MLKYIVAGALLVAVATPALAADYYVSLRYGGGCVMTNTAPSSKHYKVMGVYSTKRQAKMAMHGMMDCR
ncbi:hypothetical protein AUC69_06160 [Methyloceanibacter superfactus]|jgi:hypothetical protein|uniref:SPOR domain-containing protein n=1 Tax=Methyloceanibacter superfactus TaxID=1774969 RepID=A0A1E3W7M7_9HYPH|nr:hypothetical protein [Methyloceanibacter superfactus]ODS01809.1 hypothetical protein AUC69_06160 [Methyloceanibacter superfactus]